MIYLRRVVHCKECRYPTDIQWNEQMYISVCQQPRCNDYTKRKVIPKEYYTDITI